MLKLSPIALILLIGSFVPVLAQQQLKTTPVVEKTAASPSANPAAVEKWMGEAVERMLKGEPVDTQAR